MRRQVLFEPKALANTEESTYITVVEYRFTHPASSLTINFPVWKNNEWGSAGDYNLHNSPFMHKIGMYLFNINNDLRHRQRLCNVLDIYCYLIARSFK